MLYAMDTSSKPQERLKQAGEGGSSKRDLATQNRSEKDKSEGKRSGEKEGGTLGRNPANQITVPE